MKYFRVKSRFYDNGKVRAGIDYVFRDKKPKNCHVYLEKFDYWEDYFKTHKAALKHKKDALTC